MCRPGSLPLSLFPCAMFYLIDFHLFSDHHRPAAGVGVKGWGSTIRTSRGGEQWVKKCLGGVLWAALHHPCPQAAPPGAHGQADQVSSNMHALTFLYIACSRQGGSRSIFPCDFLSFNLLSSASHNACLLLYLPLPLTWTLLRQCFQNTYTPIWFIFLTFLLGLHLIGPFFIFYFALLPLTRAPLT